MKNKISFRDFLLPKTSIFGFKVLNSWNSIITSYSLILIEYLIIPYFGVETTQLKAGILFISLINTSITILILNSIIRIKKINLYWLVLEAPLILYLPFIIKKVFISLYSVKFIFS